MEINGTTLTLGNYASVLKDFLPEVQDELLTSLIYGVDILPFLSVNLERPELLRQIKWGLIENINPELLKCSDWRVLKKIRELNADGINLDLPSETPLWALDADVLLVVLGWLKGGANLKGYDLRLLNKNAAEAINSLVLSGEYLPEFASSIPRSKNYYNACLSLWKQGRDVTSFLNNSWSTETVWALSNIESSSEYNKVLSVSSLSWSAEDVNTAFSCVKNKVPLQELFDLYSKKNKPIPAWHMGILLEAKLSNLPLKSFISADLSQSKLENILDTRKELVKGRKIPLKR